MNESPPKSLGDSPPMANIVRALSLALAASTILVCLTRLYIRKFVLNSLGVDDYCVIVALILVLGFDIIAIVVTYYGVGYHQGSVPLEDLSTVMKINYIANAIYLVVQSAVKISLLAFIMRVFPSSRIRYLAWGLIVFLVLFSISGEIAMILQCIPPQASWDSSITKKKCMSGNTLFGVTMYQCVLMFLVDVAIIVLPMPSIWKLQMPLKRRLSISALFGLGILSCGAALARLPTLAFENDEDFTYSIAKSLVWMVVEFNIGLAVGSLPTLRKLAAFQRIFGTTQQSNTLSDGHFGPGIQGSFGQRSYPLQNTVWSSGGNTGSPKPNTIHKTLEISRSESCERILETPDGGRL